MPRVVGVLSLQGDFQLHCDAIAACGAEPRQVRMPEDLAGCEGLILPGGESTTLGILLQRHGLDQAIVERCRDGMPAWGTCMGMILMAQRVEGRDQFTLNLLDITIRRNAFGPQVHSFEQEIPVKGFVSPFPAVFIRAPIVTECGPEVESLAEVEGKVVAVRQGRLLGTAFHPELTADRRVHEYFLSLFGG